MSPAITSTKQTKPKSKKSILLSLSLSLSLSGKSFTHSVHSATPKFQYLSCKPIIANPVVNPPFPSLPFTVPIPSFSSKKQVADSISPTCILALPTMEAFSLLKYWRGSGGINSGGGGGGGGDSARTAGATTIVAAVTHNTAETDEDEDDDDGPFFDLEFAVPDEEDDAEGGDETQNREQEGTNCENESDEEEEDERESSTSRFPLVPATTERIRICLCLLPMTCFSREGSCRLSLPRLFSTPPNPTPNSRSYSLSRC
jgi:hypothetical protein